MQTVGGDENADMASGLVSPSTCREGLFVFCITRQLRFGLFVWIFLSLQSKLVIDGLNCKPAKSTFIT